MPDYRRWYVHGGTYFFTLVTYERQPILNNRLARACLLRSTKTVRKKWPFSLLAIVILPDHLHRIWSLPPGIDDFSVRWTLIKADFTRSFSRPSGLDSQSPRSARPNNEPENWQPRFWEDLVRDEIDLERCVDYIHWNPRKHGLVARIRDWRWSSFRHFVRRGQYDIDWDGTEPASLMETPSWGE